MAIKLSNSNLVKGLLNKQILVPHLDKAIAQWDDDFEFKYSPKKGDFAFHPSGDCTGSPYKLYLKAQSIIDTEEGPSFPVSTKKAFLVGHFWHQFIQMLIVDRLGFAEAKDIERGGAYFWGKLDTESGDADYNAEPFHYAKGSADVAPIRIPGQSDMLLDIKTMNKVDFNRAAPPDWLAKSWECQMNIYMDWFQLERTMVLGVCKDSPHEFREFFYEYNKPLVDTIYDKWKFVSECLVDPELEPDPDWDPPLPLEGHVE